MLTQAGGGVEVHLRPVSRGRADSWMAAISAGLAVALLILVIWPIDRRDYADEDGPDDVPDDAARGPDELEPADVDDTARTP